uniref:Uncharacterized protein n=1 Tax=Mycena chlorophos TaxID=658473 RepID=A0ABQ0L934_MYCCL|nr:predicted protein [Mycena chlorophos]
MAERRAFLSGHVFDPPCFLLPHLRCRILAPLLLQTPECERRGVSDRVATRKPTRASPPSTASSSRKYTVLDIGLDRWRRLCQRRKASLAERSQRSFSGDPEGRAAHSLRLQIAPELARPPYVTAYRRCNHGMRVKTRSGLRVMLARVQSFVAPGPPSRLPCCPTTPTDTTHFRFLKRKPFYHSSLYSMSNDVLHGRFAALSTCWTRPCLASASATPAIRLWLTTKDGIRWAGKAFRTVPEKWVLGAGRRRTDAAGGNGINRKTGRCRSGTHPSASSRVFAGTSTKQRYCVSQSATESLLPRHVHPPAPGFALAGPSSMQTAMNRCPLYALDVRSGPGGPYTNGADTFGGVLRQLPLLGAHASVDGRNGTCTCVPHIQTGLLRCSSVEELLVAGCVPRLTRFLLKMRGPRLFLRRRVHFLRRPLLWIPLYAWHRPGPIVARRTNFLSATPGLGR